MAWECQKNCAPQNSKYDGSKEVSLFVKLATLGYTGIHIYTFLDKLIRSKSTRKKGNAAAVSPATSSGTPNFGEIPLTWLDPNFWWNPPKMAMQKPTTKTHRSLHGASCFSPAMVKAARLRVNALSFSKSTLSYREPPCVMWETLAINLPWLGMVKKTHP